MRYCTRCSGSLKERQIEGVSRLICKDCESIHYQNPLPVAASVLLNEKRELLLVRRKQEPYRGEWCLPTGFAERNETIADAALRELEEETGLQAQVNRLLEASSFESDFYGSLLFVVFEVEFLSGEARAGDDAEELSWFPLDEIPPLAFPPHERAIRNCIEQHRSEWEIRDSFLGLIQSDEENLLSNVLVQKVRDRAEEISRRWLKSVRSNTSTPSYALKNPSLIQARALEALSRFCSWIGGKDCREEVEDFYLALGLERKSQGFDLHEVLSALTLLRKEIWAYVVEEEVFHNPKDVYRSMELGRRIVLFFDKALYYASLGYEREASNILHRAGQELRPYEDPFRHEMVSGILRRRSSNPLDVRVAVLRKLDLTRAKDILDLGCGFGFMAEEVARRVSVGARFTGIDACGANRGIFCRKVEGQGRHGSFVRSEIEEVLPFPDDSFDLIFSSYSLYFFPNILPELCRVMRKDGAFHALVHSPQSFHSLMECLGLAEKQTPLFGLLDRFSSENGEKKLKKHFREVHRIDYPNTLRFYSENLEELLAYLRFKMPQLQEGSQAGDLPLGMVEKARECLDRLGQIRIEKDDAAFYCRHPR